MPTIFELPGITTQQMYDTILMRYGNRQGNTALQAQIIIEAELMREEMMILPGLTESSVRSVGAVNVGPQIQFPVNDPLFLDLGLQYPIRFADPDMVGATVVINFNRTTGAIVHRPLAYLTPEELNELRSDADAFNTYAEIPTHFYLEGGATQLTVWPAPTGLWSANFFIHDGFLRLYDFGTPLLMAALGVRMGRYIKDEVELNAFRADYAIEFKRYQDRMIETEQAFKYGNRGAN